MIKQNINTPLPTLDQKHTLKEENSRILKLADPAKLLALHAARVVRVALDLLLAARDAGDGEALARLAGLGHAPVRVDHLAVDARLAVRPVVVEVAHALARHLGRAHEARQEVRARPDLGAQAVFGRDGLACG